MNTSLTLGSALVFGLLASGHCLLMCGGIAGALGMATRRDGSALSRALLLLGYQIGRVGSYALAGLIVGGIGAGIVHFVDQADVRIALRWLSALVFVALAWVLLRRGRGIDAAVGGPIWSHLAPYARRFLPVQRLSQSIAFGALWGWMPCGLVYSVLFIAALGMDPLRSAGIMLMFGLGTIPAVFAGALGAGNAMRLLSRNGVRSAVAAMLLVFAALTAGGPWLAAHGMPAAGWLPLDCMSP